MRWSKNDGTKETASYLYIKSHLHICLVAAWMWPLLPHFWPNIVPKCV